MSRREGPSPAFDSASAWGTLAPTPLQRLLLSACHGLPAGLRRLQYMLRKPLKYGVHRPLDVRIWGLRLRLAPRGNTAEVKLLFAPQFFDREELDLLAQRLRPGGVFVDIGANAGVYSFWAHRCMAGTGRILAVEPDSEMRRRLAFNQAVNQLDSITVCPVALSDHEGPGSLLVNPDQRGENTLVPEQASAAGGTRQALPVRLTTLVALLAEERVHRIDALKIDIEGHELPVLNHFYTHAPAALWPSLLIVEHKHDTQAQIDSLMLPRGYRRVLANGLNQAYERTSLAAAGSPAGA